MTIDNVECKKFSQIYALNELTDETGLFQNCNSVPKAHDKSRFFGQHISSGLMISNLSNNGFNDDFSANFSNDQKPVFKYPEKKSKLGAESQSIDNQQPFSRNSFDANLTKKVIWRQRNKIHGQKHPITLGISYSFSKQSFRHNLKKRQQTTSIYFLLNQAKQLLGMQKVREARNVLEFGLLRFIENAELIKLLDVISPGKVSQIDQSSISREKEITWIKKNGHKYSGKWIAVSGSHLIAEAECLKDLLKRLDSTKHPKNPPIVYNLSNG